MPLNEDSVLVTVFVGAGFVTNPDLSTQLGFVMVLMDSSGSAKTVYYGSMKIKLFARSVLGAGLLAMAHEINIASNIRICLN